MTGRQLREEIGTLEIDAEHFVENVLGRFGDVGTHARCDARIVDQRVEATKGGERFGHHALAIGSIADIAAHDRKLLGWVHCRGRAGGGGLLGSGAIAGEVNGDAVAGGGKTKRDATAKAAT